jgi:quercetin dioxygenase-like cupin family protein
MKQLEALPYEAAHGGAGKRQMVLSAADAISGNLEALAHTELAAGHAFDWHAHDGLDEFCWVQEGQGVISFEGGEVFAYRAGSVVYMPCGVRHKIEAGREGASWFFFVRVKA